MSAAFRAPLNSLAIVSSGAISRFSKGAASENPDLSSMKTNFFDAMSALTKRLDIAAEYGIISLQGKLALKKTSGALSAEAREFFGTKHAFTTGIQEDFTTLQDSLSLAKDNTGLASQKGFSEFVERAERYCVEMDKTLKQMLSSAAISTPKSSQGLSI